MSSDKKTYQNLAEENNSLRIRLEEAEMTLLAIQHGQVDAVVVNGPEGEQVYTLRGTDRTYRILVEEMQEGAVILHGDTIVYCNRSMTEMLGVSHQALLGKQLIPYLSPASISVFNAVTDGTSVERRAEVDLQSASGLFPAQLTVNHLEVEEMRLMALVVTDLSAHRQREQLLNSEAFVRSVIDQASDAVVVCDPNGNVILANQAAHALAGFNPLLKPFATSFKQLRQAVVEDAGTEAALDLQTLLFPLKSKNHVMQGLEAIFTRPDHREYNLLISSRPLLGSTDGIKGLVITLTDITKQKRTEMALSQEKLFLRKVIESSPSMIFVYNMAGSIVLANEAFAAFLGAFLEDIPGKTLSDFPFLTSLDGFADFLNLDLQVMEEKKEIVIREAKLTDLEKQIRYMRIVKVPLFQEDDGRCNRFLVVATDITDRKEAELNALRAKDDAEAANIAKSNFLANMSHELRTPMNAILGMTEMALSNESLPPGVDEYLETVMKSGKDLLELLNEILDFSRIEAGRFELEASEYELRGVIAQILKLMTNRAEEKGLRLSVYIDERIPVTLIGDSLRLRQILTNLLSNAIKFTERGEITLSVALNFLDKKYAILEFAVIDTGIGLAPDLIGKIFRPFSQADSSTTRRYGGTGLGLAIVAGIVGQMHGKITVDSVVGSGSTFLVTLQQDLPESRALNVRAQATDPGDEPYEIRPIAADKTDPLKILLVEDNEANQLVATVFLTKRGHAVVTADNGRKALELLSKEDFDIILMDIYMPVMDGFQAASAIRAISDERKSKIPIIALTALAMKGDREKCLDMGMDAYVSKPLDRKELIQVVEQFGKRFIKN